MSKREKLIQKIMDGRNVSYDEAETILSHLGFSVEVTGSHHVFRKNGYSKNVSLKIRAELKNYQIKLLKEVLEDHGY
jgi:predicted RNA binding protein YcfA (HicA-like mRNA interferase family)